MQPGNHVADSGVDGPGLHHNAQKTAHHQDEHADIHCVIKASEGGLQCRTDALRRGGDGVIAAGDGDTVGVVIAACRDEPCGQCHQKNHAVGIRNLRCSMGTLPPYGLTYAPMVATITALMECIRFSASSKTTL